MRQYLSRIPLALAVFLGVFSTAPVWSMAILGSPQHVWETHHWAQTLIIAVAYWILPVVIAVSILRRSFVLLPAFLGECAALFGHSLVNDIALSGQLQAMRWLLLAGMSALGVIIINRDTLTPFFAASKRFWRKGARLYSQCELPITDEAGHKFAVNMRDCSLTGIGISVEEKSARAHFKKLKVGDRVEIELGKSSKVKATLVWTTESEKTRYAGFAIEALGAMEKFLRKLPAPPGEFSLRHWLNTHWAASSFRRTAVMAWILLLIGTVGIPSCGKKENNEAVVATTQTETTMDSLVRNANSLVGLQAYFASENLTLSNEAGGYAEKFGGTVIQGIVTKLSYGTQAYVVEFDLNSIRVMAPETDETSLTDRANEELRGLLASASGFSLVVGFPDAEMVQPTLVSHPQLNAVPFLATFQVDAFLLAKSSNGFSRGLLSRSAESLSQDPSTTIVTTPKPMGATAPRCGTYSGCPTQNSNPNFPYTTTDTRGCPTVRGGTFIFDGRACSSQGQNCEYPPSSVEYNCCSTGPTGLPEWKAGRCDCDDPKMVLMQKYPEICCPPGSILVNGACACPANMALIDGECKSCGANASVINGACACKSGFTLRNGVCMCSNPNDVIVNGVCTFSPPPITCPRTTDKAPGASNYTQKCDDHEPSNCFPNDITSTVPCSVDVVWCCSASAVCGKGATRGTCQCPAPRVQSGYECKCPGGQDFDPATNTCKCPAGKVFANGACRECGPGAEPNPTQTSCLCKAATPIKLGANCVDCGPNANVVIVNNARSCQCATGFVPNVSTDPTRMPGCRACGANEEVNSAGTACQCKSATPILLNGNCVDCGPNTTVVDNNGTKSCQCLPGNVPATSTNPNQMAGCRPCGANEVISAGQCVCAAGYTPGANGCQSVCTLPKIFSAATNGCTCPPSMPFADNLGGCQDCGPNTTIVTNPNGTLGCQCIASSVPAPAGQRGCTMCAPPNTVQGTACVAPSPTPIDCMPPHVNINGACVPDPNPPANPTATPYPCAPPRVEKNGACVIP